MAIVSGIAYTARYNMDKNHGAVPTPNINTGHAFLYLLDPLTGVLSFNDRYYEPRCVDHVHVVATRPDLQVAPTATRPNDWKPDEYMAITYWYDTANEKGYFKAWDWNDGTTSWDAIPMSGADVPVFFGMGTPEVTTFGQTACAIIDPFNAKPTPIAI